MKPPFSRVDIEALTCKMRKDKSLNLEKLNAHLGPDVFQQIYRPLAATGLLPFLTQLPIKNIPDYVTEFYYNATINGDNIISTVKNQVIIVTKDTMMSTLHLPGSGPDMMNLNLPSKYELWKIWKLPHVLHNDSSHRLKESLQSDIIQLLDITSHIVHGNFKIVHLSEIKAHITATLYFGCQADWASYILAQLRANVDQFDEIIPTGELLGRWDMLPTIYYHLSSKRPHPQGPSSLDNGKAPLEATVSSIDERELLLENASLLLLSDQPTISTSSQPPPLVQSDYIEISKGTWSRHSMNHPLSSPLMLLEIMDSMIKRLQLGISADAPLSDNEPANSSCTPFIGDPPLPSIDEIFTSLGPISFREQDISDPGQFMSIKDAYAWLSPPMQIPSVSTAHNDNLATAFTFLPNWSLPSCDPLHLLDDAKKEEDGQNDDEQYNGCMILWDQIQRETHHEGEDQLQGEAWTLQGVQERGELSRRKKSNRSNIQEVD
ncbi:hypothetical protein C2S51_029022 [Perilla frutescens var. frutescens]|nr:hypothetical protein C2S51_029022 [Perilla frutescens var. frutescens]